MKKKSVKKMAMVRYRGKGSALEAFGEEVVESLLFLLGWGWWWWWWWMASSSVTGDGGPLWERGMWKMKWKSDLKGIRKTRTWFLLISKMVIKNPSCNNWYLWWFYKNGFWTLDIYDGFYKNHSWTLDFYDNFYKIVVKKIQLFTKVPPCFEGRWFWKNCLISNVVEN